jgi:long-chain acyl-CoA synthetase
MQQEFSEGLQATLSKLSFPSSTLVFDSSELQASYRHWKTRYGSKLELSVERPEDVAAQLYTSGTTGRAKGAMLTKQGFAESIPDAVNFWQMRADSRVLCVLPMFHIAGLGTVVGALWAKAQIVLSDAAHPEGILAAIESAEITHLILVSVMLQALVASPACASARLTSLQTISYGAAPISISTLNQALELMDCRIMQPYGLTETTGVVSLLDNADHRRFANDPTQQHRLASCGKPRAGVEVKIVNPDSGESLPANTPGELWVKTGRLMIGYANLPSATGEALPGDGWFRTGDIATLDPEGYITLKDRLKDVIISGGENIYPIEVENALIAHPEIADVAVIGQPSEQWGETPVAIVVCKSDAPLTEQQVIAFAREKLAHFKCPSHVFFVRELPRNATGKVLRKALRHDTSWREASYASKPN